VKVLWQAGRLPVQPWEPRVALIFEPRDCWLGFYPDPRKRVLYITVIPMLPVRVSW
jgi:hypothetical protein